MKQTKSDNKISLYSVATGTGVACVFSLAAVFLGAMLICNEYVGEGGITFFQLAVYFLSALLGCFVAEKLSATNKLLACGITVVSYYIILIGTSCLFFEGVSGMIWMGIIPVLVAFLVSMLWISKPHTGRKVRRRKTARR